MMEPMELRGKCGKTEECVSGIEEAGTMEMKRLEGEEEKESEEEAGQRE